MCIFAGESKYGCVGSHSLVSVPQSVAACIRLVKLVFFIRISSVMAEMFAPRVFF
jgi:hypothetical protein